MKVTTIEVDLAKTVFQVHGVDGSGKTVVRVASRFLHKNVPVGVF